MKIQRAVIVLALLLAAAVATAGDVRQEPGYFNLEWIEIPDNAEQVKDIDMHHALLAIATDAEKTGDPELAEMLSLLKSVRVKAYSLDENSNKATLKVVERVNSELKNGDWKRLFFVKDEDSVVTIHTKHNKDNQMVGMVLVAFAADEDVYFVNVVGELDLPLLFKLASGIDDGTLDALEELEIKLDE